MANLSISGLAPEALAVLQSKATQEGASVNALVLRWIQQGLEQVSDQPMTHRHDDLDQLAGAWTPEEAAEFLAATEGFGRVDPDQWP
ncbi:hypothetical protein Thiowin_00162 [Thiorhodovibrio winogradskyi]|uniref:Antitoxin n=1 Tax=Thiorhodovibrio winogradskyi TaxID=77007 RepID=A0ABZ0S3V2_9GAMM|nr:hypothetical protein [Thiorhodovibrio winogradskyi]